MDGLFDFSGGAPSVLKHKRDERVDEPVTSWQSNPTKSAHQDDEEMRNGEASSQDSDSNSEDYNAPSSSRPKKRRRRHEPAPKVLDEFETQANREVAVNEGLTASAEADAGQRLLLTHQACMD